jgi:hypothetical protein
VLEFESTNPFPLLDPTSHTYHEAQAHSALADQWLGLQAQPIEELLLKNQSYEHGYSTVQFWRGLSLQAMQTPYTEIRHILSLLDLQNGHHVVDLGCSYGRMGHVIGRHYPEVSFTGYELVAERVQEGNRVLARFHYPRVAIETKDLSSAVFLPPDAEFYFIFDFGSASAIEKTLQDLRRIAQRKPITLVGRGRGIRHQIYQSHPWLCQIKTPQVHGNFTIFYS